MDRWIRFPVIALFGLVVSVVSPGLASGTALDDYVSAPDPNYSYTVTRNEHRVASGVGYTFLQLRLYSQAWRTTADVNRPVWRHWLTVAIPDEPVADLGLLAISGGSYGAPVTNLDPYLDMVMASARTVLGFLEQVPNEPLKFTDEPDPRYVAGGRSEDQIIAYSYDKYMKTLDGTWPVLLPMVKSAVRALDTIQTLASNQGVSVTKFVVGGASKRGWTTWLTTAVDPRVVACVPIVIDVLNMAPQMDHHLKAYGSYSVAIQDYVDLHIFERIDTPEGQALRGIVDPYEYRNRLTMPKCLINSSGDEFFLCDSSRFYYKDLPGEKHIRYVPNTGHSLDTDMNSILSILQFYLSIVQNRPRPQFSWTFETDGSIRVQTVDRPTLVRLWQATNPTARDFRWFDGTGPQWTSTDLTEQKDGSGVYVANVAPPASGWTGFLAELWFSDGSVYSTEVRITPDYLPFEAPRVLSTQFLDTDPKDRKQLRFIARFDRPVTGADDTDFELLGPAADGAEIVDVQPANGAEYAQEYVVSVALGNGTGAMSLGVLDDDTIEDAKGQTLGGPGAGNGAFSNGTPYMVALLPLGHWAVFVLVLLLGGRACRKGYCYDRAGCRK